MMKELVSDASESVLGSPLSVPLGRPEPRMSWVSLPKL